MQARSELWRFCELGYAIAMRAQVCIIHINRRKQKASAERDWGSQMFRITFAGMPCNYLPTFSTEKRAWDFIKSELDDEAQDAYDMGERFDYDHALSFYNVVPTFLRVVK